MATTAKALEIAAALKDELALRTGLAVVLAFDADNNPLLKIGSVATGEAGALVKVQPIDWPLAKDILGLDQRVYTPHEILFVTEASSIAGDPAAIVEPFSAAQKAKVLMALAGQGCRVKVYEIAAGEAPAFVDAVLKATFEDLKYPMVKSQ